MDVEIEQIAQKALREFCVHRTILCVAHRLVTILDADQVLVLKEGQIVEEGAPDALANMKDSYFASLLGDR
jgi:ABC-type multidrug transport system fused ATPase/permease subunit